MFRSLRPANKRLILFLLVGGTVFLLGNLFLILLVEGLKLGLGLSYAVQLIVSLQLAFILNSLVTWRDRPAETRWEMARRWLKFHGGRAATVGGEQVLFVIFVSVFGFHYLLANGLTIAAGTMVNFLVGETVVFQRSLKTQRPSDFP